MLRWEQGGCPHIQYEELPPPHPLTSEASLLRLGWPEGPWLEVRGFMLVLLLLVALVLLLPVLELLVPARPPSLLRLEELCLQT